jgi:predicted phage terminase large subunit-like protein
MKSLTVSVFWPCWEWLERPELRWLFASYAQQLSTRDSMKCRRVIDSPVYQRVLAHLPGEPWRLTSDQNEKTRFENDRTGYRISTSVGGSATGEGGDRVVIDDPHKVREVESDLIRTGVLDWHDQTISTRFNDPKTGAEVVVMQRVHENDLTGHLLEKSGWEHLCLPAEFEPSHPFVWPDDRRSEAGELLWPAHFGRDELDTLKNDLGSYGAAGQLQQRPAPLEGGLFKRADWRFYDPNGPMPVFTAVGQSWDTAFKDKQTSDYHVGQVWGLFGAYRYLLRSVRFRGGLAELKLQVKLLNEWTVERYGRLPIHVLVEKSALGVDILAEMRGEIGGLVSITARGDKTQRAHAASPQVEAHQVFLPGWMAADMSGPDTARTPLWVQDFVDEHAGFPNGAHDDQVDAETQLLNWARGRGSSGVGPLVHRERPRMVSAGLQDRTF